MRDESLYIYVLEAVLEAPVLDEVSKIRPAHLLELALKNRVGEPATDFTYTLADGKKETLYHTKADYLLLFSIIRIAMPVRRLRTSLLLLRL